MSNIDIARALKDKDYFHSLTPEQQDTVRREGGLGEADVTDETLESISGGLGGSDELNYTGSTEVRGSAAALAICNC